MYAMKPADRRELAEYRALGTVEELKARLTRPLPDDDGLAPLPWADHDPAQEAADGYLDDWDYLDEHQRKRHSGLLEDEA